MNSESLVDAAKVWANATDPEADLAFEAALQLQGFTEPIQGFNYDFGDDFNSGTVEVVFESGIWLMIPVNLTTT